MDIINQYSSQIIWGLAILAALILVLLLFRNVTERVRGKRGQRLGISEYHELDQSRRLVLVRRDNVEHLLLIGGSQDVVVESGIGVAQQPIYGEYESEPEMRAAPPLRAQPRPPVFGDRKPPPLRAVERVEPPLAGSRIRDPDEP